jgi:hypothetical protein
MMKDEYKILVGKPQRTRPLGRRTHRSGDSIKMDLAEIGSEIVGWIHLAQDRYQWRSLVNILTNLLVP